MCPMKEDDKDDNQGASGRSHPKTPTPSAAASATASSSGRMNPDGGTGSHHTEHKTTRSDSQQKDQIYGLSSRSDDGAGPSRGAASVSSIPHHFRKLVSTSPRPSLSSWDVSNDNETSDSCECMFYILYYYLYIHVYIIMVMLLLCKWYPFLLLPISTIAVGFRFDGLNFL